MSISINEVTEALQSTRVSPNGVSFEGKSLKLDTEEDAKIVIEAINNSNDLEYLNLEGNTLGVDAAKAIAKALEKHPKFKRALWKDMFTGRMKTEIPQALEYLGNGLITAGARLIELDLSDNAFGPNGVQGLVSLLRSSTCYALEELRLNNNGLGITGGKLLASALLDCYNSSKQQGKPLALRVFIAGRNRLENDGAKALAQVFKTIETLEEIAMPQNGIYHVGISALSEAFMHNKNLQILNLNDNTIGPKGALAIAQVMPNLQKLRQLNFGDCLLKSLGARVLANGLKDNHTELEELILGFNEICIDGGIAVVDAMSNKIKLKSLFLDGNAFNEEGKTKIMKRMKELGKFNALSSLEECEEPEDGENSENEESDTEADTTVEELPDIETKFTITENGNKTDAYQTFINAPSADNFMNLGSNKNETVLVEFKKMSKSNFIDLVPIIMKISALSTSNQEEIAKSSLNCSEILYEELFSWAVENQTISLVNNFILVQLLLIKSEDKEFKPSWDMKGCLLALDNIVNKNFLPESTKTTLQVFIEREVQQNGDFIDLKKSILSKLVSAKTN